MSSSTLVELCISQPKILNWKLWTSIIDETYRPWWCVTWHDSWCGKMKYKIWHWWMIGGTVHDMEWWYAIVSLMTWTWWRGPIWWCGNVMCKTECRWWCVTYTVGNMEGQCGKWCGPCTIIETNSTYMKIFNGQYFSSFMIGWIRFISWFS